MRARAFVAILLVAPLLGCWEQFAPEWFAQMKQQAAVQALEGVRPMDPPAGTIPFGGIEPRIAAPIPAFDAAAIGLPNPIPATPESIERGRQVFDIYCALCHGADGMANAQTTPMVRRLSTRDGQPRPPGEGMTPPPLVAVPAYTDGFIFTKIRYGRPQMPGYPQIPPEDRWHVVNYLRTLIKGS